MIFLAWEDYHNFYHAFWKSFTSWEKDLYKIQGRETLSISHNNLNTIDNNAGLTKNFSMSTELHNMCVCV
jgi:hypothetical protein